MDWKFVSLLIPAAVQTVYTVASYYRNRPMTSARQSYWIIGAMLFLTWAAVAYDIYDRRQPLTSREITYAPSLSTEINMPSALGTNTEVLYYAFPQLEWPVHQLKQIKDQVFDHTVVPLDGYVYVNCSFSNVTFQYEGTDLTGGWIDAKKLENVTIATREAHLRTLIALLQSSGIIAPDFCPATSTPPPSRVDYRPKSKK